MRKSQKLLVGLASLTLWDIAVASAADLPVKAQPPAPVATYNWSGFYVGVHAGYRWADASFSGPGFDFNTGNTIRTFPPRNESYHPNGGIAGVQAGYNFMITPAILAGIEADWSYGSGSDSLSGAGLFDPSGIDGFTFHSQVQLTWQATVRGRLGVVNGPWLIYGTGGAAFTRAHWNDSYTLASAGTTFASSSDGSKTLSGWTVGGGVEYMFASNSNWIARLEYLYENFGNVTVPFGFGQIGTLDLKDVNKVRLAISYKFNP
jgi:opacity protein-like surface antigen